MIQIPPRPFNSKQDFLLGQWLDSLYRAVTTDLPITIGTPIATTSGASHDFTGIPTRVRRITITFSGVSLSGTDNFLVQIGDSGGVETSGYVSTSGAAINAVATSVVSSTAGFIVISGTAANLLSGHVVLLLCDPATNIWVSSHSMKASTTAVITGGGDKALSAELTTVRITRTGTDTFDAGTVNILYER